MLTALPLTSIIPTYAKNECDPGTCATPWHRGACSLPTQRASYTDSLAHQRKHRSGIHDNSHADANHNTHPITNRHLDRDSHRDPYPNYHTHTYTHTDSQRPVDRCATSLCLG
jgi:hypothetical protein